MYKNGHGALAMAFDEGHCKVHRTVSTRGLARELFY